MSRLFKILPSPSARPARPPLAWRPTGPDDLCDPAATVARRLVAKARKLHDDPSVPVKLLLYGPPGVGKTSIADMVADALSGTRFAITVGSGRCVRAALADLESWLDAEGMP